MQELVKLYNLMSPTRRRHLYGTLILMLLGVLSEMVTVGSIVPFLALISGGGAKYLSPGLLDILSLGGKTPLFGASILLIGAVVIATIVRLFLSWMNQSFAMKLGHELAADIFGRMLGQRYSEHVNNNSSEILALLSKVQDAMHGFVQPLMQGFIAIITTVCISAILLYVDPFMTTVGAVTIAFAYAVISIFTLRRMRSNSGIIANTTTSRIKLVQEGLGGFRDIVLGQCQSIFKTKFRAVDFRYRRAVAVNAFVASSPRFVIEAIGIVAIIFISIVVSQRPGGLVEALPALGALGLGIQRLLPLTQQAWNGWGKAAGSIKSLAEVVALLEQPPQADAFIVTPLAFENMIEMKGVSFAYESGDGSLNDISLGIEAGDRVGILGATGSGKSTLLDLLTGLLEPQSGEILIDGRALDSQNCSAWQAAIAYVPQTVFLADDSIMANIAFSKTEGEIEPDIMDAAIRAAGLKQFLSGLDAGLDTVVGERGIRLSGGQRQRIGIARALYQKPSVLLLDEASSALDSKTEAAVLDAIDKWPGKMTIITVAHRPSSLSRCTKIFHIKDGSLHTEQPA